MTKIRDDRRVPGTPPKYGWVIFKDSFMSGWGECEGGRSFYALACDTPDEALTVLANGKCRSDMKNGRIQPVTLPLPRLQLRENDHLSVVDKHRAGRWFEPKVFDR